MSPESSRSLVCGPADPVAADFLARAIAGTARTVRAPLTLLPVGAAEMSHVESFCGWARAHSWQ